MILAKLDNGLKLITLGFKAINIVKYEFENFNTFI
jgi:hypothetical protein